MYKLKKRSLFLFNHWARFYDSKLFTWFFNPYYKKVQTYLGELNDKHILSVGCGTGTLEISLAQKNRHAEIVGLDISKMMIQQAQKKSNNISNISFVEGDSECLPYDSESFHIVLCIHSFHHYPNQEKTLSEFKRVLKQNGILIIIDPLKDNFFTKILLTINTKCIERGVIHPTKEKITQMIKMAKFTDIHIEKISLINNLIVAK